MIYPVDSVIQRLNNRGQAFTKGAMEFEPNVNITLFKDSLKNLGDLTLLTRAQQISFCLAAGLVWSKR